MDGDLQIANNIIRKDFGKPRYKIVNSIDKLKNKCIMIEINNDFSPSIVLYFNNKNDDNVEEIIDSFHFGNRTGFQHNDVFTSVKLSLYETGEDDFSLQFQL